MEQRVDERKAERQERVVKRRLQMILRRRVMRFNLTVYKGGFVNVNDLLNEAPIFKRFDMTAEDLKNCIKAEPEIYTLQGDFVKVNEGHKFDVNDEKLPDLPSA